MSKTTNQTTEIRTYGEYMDKCMRTLMQHLSEKVYNPPTAMEPPKNGQQLDQDDTIEYLIVLLLQKRQFAYYRTNGLTHAQFLEYWRVIAKLHESRELYVYRRSSTKQRELKESIDAIREARLWGYENLDCQLDSREAKEVRETLKWVNLVWEYEDRGCDYICTDMIEIRLGGSGCARLF